MRIVVGALMLTLATVPAYAQATQTTSRTDAQKKADKEADDAYNAMIKNVPDKTRNTDPWRDMRSSDAAANNTATSTGAASNNPTHKAHPTTKKPK